MNAKNWRACVKDGVTKSKPVYAAQIAVYQAYMEASVPGISAAPAVFTAINKDTAEMHHEQVPFDADLAQRMRGSSRPSCANGPTVLHIPLPKPETPTCRDGSTGSTDQDHTQPSAACHPSQG